MVALMETEDDELAVRVGDRVEVSGYRGTVKYYGPVPPATGIWLGVDWDDSQRGKHDGMYNDVRYFQARFPTSGTFIRPNKLSKRQSIIEALQEKYLCQIEQVVDKELEVGLQRAINAPFVKMVGFEKVARKQQLSHLEIAALRELRIHSSGEPGLLEKICPTLKELDLSRNLFNSWTSVASVVKQLPHLQFLDLSENMLRYDSTVIQECSECFRILKCLILNKIEYDWRDVICCAELWPQIEELQLSCNKITSINPLPGHLLQGLVKLNLEGNPIQHWSSIEVFGSLQGLEFLNLSNTQLLKVRISSPSMFPALDTLWLSGNLINDWESVDELDKLPLLKDLKFKNNPVLDQFEFELSLQFVIARISKLEVLNSRLLLADERRGAEIDYLKHYGNMWIESASSPEKRQLFLNNHRNYTLIIKKFGEIDAADYEVKPDSLKNKLVSVLLVDKQSGRSLKKRLPLAMTVQKLCSLVQKLFKTADTAPSLSVVSSSTNSKLDQTLCIEMDNTLKSLSFYSVEDGDTIEVVW